MIKYTKQISRTYSNPR